MKELDLEPIERQKEEGSGVTVNAVDNCRWTRILVLLSLWISCQMKDQLTDRCCAQTRGLTALNNQAIILISVDWKREEDNNMTV